MIRMFFVLFVVVVGSVGPPQNLEELRLAFPDVVDEDVRLQEFFLNQFSIDERNTEFVPELTSLPQPYGANKSVEISISPQTSPFRTQTSVILHTSCGLMIKYQTDCFGSNSIHPLLTDAWFLDIAGTLNLSPRMLFVSPAVRHPKNRSLKTNFKMTNEEFDKCHSDGANIRFMVMENGGPTLFREKKSGKISFTNAIRIGKRIIQILRDLHLEGRIVHGDIHSGNVLIRDGTVSLIDFGYGKFANESDKVRIVRRPFSCIHYLLSPWEIVGYDSTMRDDVYRAMFILAEMIFGDGFTESWIVMHSQPNKLIQRMMSGNMFAAWSKSVPDPIESLNVSAQIKAGMKERLTKMLEIVRACEPADNAPPPYEEIIVCLEEIERLV